MKWSFKTYSYMIERNESPLIEFCISEYRFLLLVKCTVVENLSMSF